jgi:alkyl sulfatase BDS1-like metallo-beta-lactamase superfamily hydrolase
MMRALGSYRLVLAGFFAATALPSTLQAQTASGDTPEMLAEAAASIDTGMTLARRQVAETDYLGAAGTLERVLFANPDAPEPRLLYASLLCRLDDPEGASIELALVKAEAITDASWGEVTSACGPIARPAPGSVPATPEGSM